MSTTSKVVHFGSKGQVVIPHRIRRQYEIENGTRATVIPTPEGILLRPITRAFLRGLRGSLAGTRAMAVFLQERKRERER